MLAAAGFAACSPGQQSASPVPTAAAPESATGVIIGADGPSAADVDRVTLRTNDGRILELRVGTLDVTGGGGTAPHLREHMLSGHPVTVFFRGDELIKYVDVE